MKVQKGQTQSVAAGGIWGAAERIFKYF